MLLGTALCIGLLHLLNPNLFTALLTKNLQFTIRIDLSLLLLLVALLFYMFFREMIHAVFVPGILKSDKPFWGLNVLFSFVYTAEPIQKWRFFVISMMPFILPSIVAPFLIAPFFQTTAIWLHYSR